MSKQAKQAKIPHAIFRAVASHVSDNPTRNNLHYVHVVRSEFSTQLEATDGFIAIRIDAPNTVLDLASGFYDPRTTLALLGVGAVPPAVDREMTFPNLSQVIPDKTETLSPPALYDPAYLSHALDSVAKIGSAMGQKHISSRIQFGADALSPARIDASVSGVSIVAVVMPRRA